MTDLKLYKFDIIGSDGRLEGLFLATEAEIDNIIGKNIYFREVLCKYTDVCITNFKRKYLQRIDDVTESLILDLHTLFGKTLSGYNPVEMYREYLEDNGLIENDGEKNEP